MVLEERVVWVTRVLMRLDTCVIRVGLRFKSSAWI